MNQVPDRFGFLRHPGVFWGLLAFLLFSHLAFLGADPPFWQPGEFITDEGWWADSARGIHLFGDPFADDFGTGYLLCPLYTWILCGVYEAFGLGLAQTRAVVAVACLLLILVPAFWMRRVLGRKASSLFLLLLSLDLVLFTYGRVAILEALVAFFLLLSILPWLSGGRAGSAAKGEGAGRDLGGGTLSGLAMAAAIFTKPIALTYGLAPVGITALVMVWSGRARARRLLVAIAAFGTAVATVFFFHIQPNFDRWWVSISHEAGLGFSEGLPPYLRLGNLFSSQEWNGWHKPLWLLKTSPLLLVFLWSWGLNFLEEVRVRGSWRRVLADLPAWHLGALCWWVAGYAVYREAWREEYRRLPMLMVPAAMLATGLVLDPRAAFGGRMDGATGAEGSRRTGPLWTFVFLLPLLLVLDPLLAPRAAPFFAGLFGLEDPSGTGGLVPGASIRGGHAAAGLFLLLVYFGFCFVLPSRIRDLLRRGFARLGPRFLLAAAVLAGVFQVSLITWHFATIRHGFRKAGEEIADGIPEGSVVLGDFGSSLLLGKRFRTVRRVKPGSHSAPPPNPDVVDRLDPKWLIDCEYCEYVFYPRKYAEMDRKYGFEFLRRIEVGPYVEGVPRYSFLLFGR